MKSSPLFLENYNGPYIFIENTRRDGHKEPHINDNQMFYIMEL